MTSMCYCNIQFYQSFGYANFGLSRYWELLSEAHRGEKYKEWTCQEHHQGKFLRFDLVYFRTNLEMFTPRKVKKAPDGGWGWVCVVAGCVCVFVLGGVPMTLSPLFQQLRQRFETSASDTSLVYALYAVTTMMAGKSNDTLLLSKWKICIPNTRVKLWQFESEFRIFQIHVWSYDNSRVGFVYSKYTY